MEDIRSYPIEELELGVRAYNILKRMGMYTWGDILDLTVQDLNTYTRVTGVGVGLPSFRQIAEAQNMIRNY